MLCKSDKPSIIIIIIGVVVQGPHVLNGHLHPRVVWTAYWPPGMESTSLRRLRLRAPITIKRGIGAGREAVVGLTQQLHRGGACGRGASPQLTAGRCESL